MPVDSRQTLIGYKGKNFPRSTIICSYIKINQLTVMTRLSVSLALVLCILACKCKASPIFRTESSTGDLATQGTSSELAVTPTTDLAVVQTKEIDTLTEKDDETSVRVKRQGGCGCCCCRPCCCCCRPCCCCCKCCCKCCCR